MQAGGLGLQRTAVVFSRAEAEEQLGLLQHHTAEKKVSSFHYDEGCQTDVSFSEDYNGKIRALWSLVHKHMVTPVKSNCLDSIRYQ